MVVCGGGALLPELIRTLESDGWHVALPFGLAPTIEVALPDDVPGIHSRAGRVGLPGGPEAVTTLCLAAAAARAVAGA
jgi:hypothetical protein